MFFLFQESSCGPEDISVMSGDIFDWRFPLENLLSHDLKELPGSEVNNGAGRTNYWLAKYHSPASFILNLGCILNFDGIRLVNTHNRWAKNKGTKQFKYVINAINLFRFCKLLLSRLFVSTTGSGPWTEILEKELKDSRCSQDPLPLQTIPLEKKISSQFLKFELISWWGIGGGLLYFDVQRNGEEKIF